MRIFVTGGTGFVGGYVVRELLAAGHRPVLLVRAGKPREHPEGVETVQGDIFDANVMKWAMVSCDAVIHLVGIIRETGDSTFRRVHYEGSKNVIDAVLSAGVKRFVHMSAEGTREGAPSMYHRTKYMAEEHLKASGLTYTIFRPAMMFGPGDSNFSVLAEMARRSPVMPVIGDGKYKWQPVCVRDVARAFVRSLDMDAAYNMTYEVRGPRAYTFNEILALVMETAGVRRPVVHLPVWLMRPVVKVMDSILKNPPITTDQLKMLLDDYTHPAEEFTRDFGMKLESLETVLKEYI